MNGLSASLAVLCLLFVSAGVAWIYPPAGLITFGVLLGAAGWMLLDAKDSP